MHVRLRKISSAIEVWVTENFWIAGRCQGGGAGSRWGSKFGVQGAATGGGATGPTGGGGAERLQDARVWCAGHSQGGGGRVGGPR